MASASTHLSSSIVDTLPAATTSEAPLSVDESTYGKIKKERKKTSPGGGKSPPVIAVNDLGTIERGSGAAYSARGFRVVAVSDQGKRLRTVEHSPGHFVHNKPLKILTWKSSFQQWVPYDMCILSAR